MAIKLPCPRCKKPLAVPNKKAGTYVNCPLCNGRLWVPKDSQADAAHLDEVVAQSQPAPSAPEETTISASGNPPRLPPAASPATLAKVLTPPGANAPLSPNLIAGSTGVASPGAGSPIPGSPIAGSPIDSGPTPISAASVGSPAGALPSSKPAPGSGAGAPISSGVVPSGTVPGASVPGGVSPAGQASLPAGGYMQSQPQTPGGAASSGYRPQPQSGYGQGVPVPPPVVAPGSYPSRAAPGAATAATWPAGGMPTGGVQPTAAGTVPPSGATPPQPPPVAGQSVAAAPAQMPKVPRFISADAALSRLQVASDGRLPQLHLHESSEEPKQKQQERTVNPVLLFALLGVSVLVSILMVLLDSGGQSPQQGRSAEAAWRIIEGEYFGDPDKPQRPLRYQELLRDAQRARNRGDLESQKKLLREVLAMLDAEPHPNDRGRGLTGSPGRDKRLREQIIVLLREN